MRSASKFLQLLREAKASGVLVEEVTWARLAQVTGGSVHQGIALQTAAADTLDLNALIDGCSELGEPPLLLALDGITDPHNLGAVVRSAERGGGDRDRLSGLSLGSPSGWVAELGVICLDGAAAPATPMSAPGGASASSIAEVGGSSASAPPPGISIAGCGGGS